jgi:hypothetical protein
MGDVSTHGEIDAKVIDIVQSHIPEADAQCVELGNWMTDFSQFRDPTAFMSGKLAVWDAQRHGLGLIPLALSVIANLDAYLDDLMGKPGQDGAMAKWAKQVARAVTLHNFVDKKGMDADEVDRLFEKYFTQYYPHEHLDFPPWPWGTIIGDRTPTSVGKHNCDPTQDESGKRWIFQYTDEQLEYVSDRLTAVQEKWRHWEETHSEGDSRESLHEILCEYGHGSHAVEDFFFHSNFIEMAWRSQRGELPSNNQEIRHKRRFYRRLRAPLGTGGGADLDKTSSLAADITYTGYFGSKDVFHTFADGVKGIIAKMGTNPAIAAVMGPLRQIPDDDEDTDGSGGEKHGFSNKDDRAKMLEDYRKDYRNGTIGVLLDAEAAAGKLHAKVVEAAKQAMKIDDDLALARRGMGVKDMGVLGLVLEIGAMAETEHKNSDKRSKELDDQNTLSDDRSDNGASAENIGSHSLMSKDSVRKEPLRVQAVNVASMAAKYVARAMLEVVYPSVALTGARFHSDTSSGDRNTVDEAGGLDWLHLLRHFICHPQECEENWCDAALDSEEAPNYHVPKYLERDETERRAEEPHREALEQKYKDGETYFQQAWQKRVLENTVQDSAILGAVAGAIAGAIIGAAVGGPMGAVVGAVVGALAGGALGALIGAVAGIL